MKENEVLARFDGYTVRYASDTTAHNTGLSSWPLFTKDGKTTDVVFYDTSWDALMPVWYKFKELKFSYGNDEANHEQLCDAIEDAILHKGPSPEEACKRLSEAIEWYNANKQM